DDELGAHAHLFHELVETAYVDFVERRVDFVKDAERTRSIAEDSDEQGESGERLLSAGEQQHVLKLLARRRGDDIDAALGRILFVGELHEGHAAAEELLE